MEINIIRMAIANSNLLITNHAAIEAENDDLLLDSIYYSVNFGEIIQFYPDDKPFPSCLICGFDADNHPIHSVWAYNSNKSLAILITVYRPNPNLWVNWRQRRKK